MNTTEIVALTREARVKREPLRIRGAGTWLTGGQPVGANGSLSLADDQGIVDYVPGDLTLTARAGTRLSEIAAATHAHGQWLPLDPWGGDDGTLGATLATATAGPHAHATGLPRDVVLGVEFVTGTGQVVRAGGRVVKNVAGFDLTRLVVGSWGTLGVITEATVRLRALPEEARTIAVAVDSERSALNALARRLRALPFVPMAAELLSGRLASQLGLGGVCMLVVQVAGNARSVRAQLALLRDFGDARDVNADIWSRIRTVESASSAAWRWSRIASEFGNVWAAAEAAVAGIETALVHGSPMRGVARVVVPFADTIDVGRLARAASAFDGTIAIENLPRPAWRLVQHRPAADPLSRAIRAKFDPDAILNPGILGAQ